MKRVVVRVCLSGLALGVAAVGFALRPGASAEATSSSVVVARNARAQHPATKAAHPVRAETVALTGTTVSPLPAAYRMLLARSIFCVGPVDRAKSDSSTGGILALRGIMQEGRGFIAFVENTSSRQAQQVRIGDAVGRGKIVDLDLHAVRYATGGRSTRVAVGQTFDGGSSAASIADPATGAVATVRPGPE
jgi:hypothetical protein